MDMQFNVPKVGYNPFRQNQAPKSPTRNVWINGELVQSKLNPEAKEFKPSMPMPMQLPMPTQWLVTNPILMYNCDQGHINYPNQNVRIPFQGVYPEMHQVDLMNKMQNFNIVMGNGIDYADTAQAKMRMGKPITGGVIKCPMHAKAEAAMNGVLKLMPQDEHRSNLQNNAEHVVGNATTKQFFNFTDPVNLHVPEKVVQFGKNAKMAALTLHPPPPPPPPMQARAIIKTRETPPAVKNPKRLQIDLSSIIEDVQNNDAQKTHQSGGDSEAEKIPLQKDTLKVLDAEVNMIDDAEDGLAPPCTPVGKFLNNTQPITQDDIKLMVEKKWSLKKLTSFVGSMKPSTKKTPHAAGEVTAQAPLFSSVAAISSSNTSNSSAISTSSATKKPNVDKKTNATVTLQRNKMAPSPHDIRKSEASTRLVARTVAPAQKAAPPVRSLTPIPKALPKDPQPHPTVGSVKTTGSPEKARGKVAEKSKAKSSCAATKK